MRNKQRVALQLFPHALALAAEAWKGDSPPQTLARPALALTDRWTAEFCLYFHLDPNATYTPQKD